MPVEGCTPVGPRLILTAPVPVAPPHSLVNTPGVVVADSDPHWMNGATIDVDPGTTPSLWTDQESGTFRTKDDGGSLTFPDFNSFVVYLPVTCSAFTWQRTRDRSLEVLEATYSHAVERVLMGGITPSGGVTQSPYFGNTSLTILPAAPGVAQNPAQGLAYLENAIGATGRMGMIHTTPAVISALDQSDKLDGSNEGPLTTVNGTPVVSGTGYIAGDPDSGTRANGHQDWMFATGPVQVRVSPPIITDLRETLDRDDNSVTFRAERVVLATWDTALQAGVLVDWTT